MNPICVKAMTTSLVGRRSVGKFLGLRDGISESQPGDIARQFVVRDTMVADAKDGDFDVLRTDGLFHVGSTSGPSSPY